MKTNVRNMMLTVSSILTIGVSTVFVADAKTTYSYIPSKLTLNGKQLSTPSHITAKDPFGGASAGVTSFLPIWYTDIVLKDAGITPSWNGQILNLQVPSNMKVNYSATPKSMNLSSDVMAIEINGKIVTYAPKIAYYDKGSSTVTTFVPVYYLEKVFGYLNFQTSWDGTNWAVTGSVTQQTGQTYPDGWKAPVLTQSWNSSLSANNEAGEFKLFQNDLGFGYNGHTYSISGQQNAIIVGDSGMAGHGSEVQISFSMWGPDTYDTSAVPGVPDAYRIPVIAKQLFNFYFGSDSQKVWNYFNSGNVPGQFTANGRTVYTSNSDATGQLIMDIGYPASK